MTIVISYFFSLSLHCFTNNFKEQTFYDCYQVICVFIFQFSVFPHYMNHYFSVCVCVCGGDFQKMTADSCRIEITKLQNYMRYNNSQNYNVSPRVDQSGKQTFMPEHVITLTLMRHTPGVICCRAVEEIVHIHVILLAEIE